MELIAFYAHAAPTTALFYDLRNPQTQFVASEIRRAFVTVGTTLSESDLDRFAGDPSTLKIVISSDPAGSAKLAESLGVTDCKAKGVQSYSIRRIVSNGHSTVLVLGADATGAMYGGLDIAKSIRLGSIGTLAVSDHAPYIERRGIKFNVPLDARTPSYSDNSDAAQNNIAEMGASISGTSSSTKWRVIGITCCRSAICTHFLRW